VSAFAGESLRCLHDAIRHRCGSMAARHAQERVMKSHWSDWLMGITLLIALGAAAMCEVVDWPIPVHMLN
jgi:hypothetical protein